eukprot:13638906-Heterocapsa_arctica.AAC.1
MPTSCGRKAQIPSIGGMAGSTSPPSAPGPRPSASSWAGSRRSRASPNNYVMPSPCNHDHQRRSRHA